MLLFGVIGVGAFNSFLIKVLTLPIMAMQTSSVDEIFGENFELVGSQMVVKDIIHQKLVIFISQ